METKFLALNQYMFQILTNLMLLNIKKFRSITLTTFPVVFSNFNNLDFGIEFLLPAQFTLYNFAVCFLLTHGNTRKFTSADDGRNTE